MERPRPRIGVPRTLEDGEEWTSRPKVTLIIDSQIGQMIEVRSEDGTAPTTTRTTFTPASEEDEREALDATRFG